MIRDTERFEQFALAAAVMEAHDIVFISDISNDKHINQHIIEIGGDEGRARVGVASRVSSCYRLR